MMKGSDVKIGILYNIIIKLKIYKLRISILPEVVSRL